MLKKALILLGLPLMLGGCERSATLPGDAHTAEVAALASQGGLVRTTWPSRKDPGPPFYARIDDGGVLIVDGWAVIPFYRDPGCVPAAFNLLGFFDPSAAFDCSLTLEGFSLWRGEAFVGAPKIVHMQGLGAVPFWIIPAEAVLGAIQDGVLTIGDLAGLEGRLVGHATHFNELLQPHPLPPFLGGGGHPNPKIVLNAQGRLGDDRRFLFQLTRQDLDVTSIRLRLW